MAMSLLRNPWRMFTNAHPLKKGIISYAVLWPTANLIQQTMEGKNLKTYDWKQCARFSIFGGLYVAPSLYLWVRLTSSMWPQMSLKIAMTKALIEQVSYGPFACASFFIGMNLLEFKSIREAIDETKVKFLPTFKTGICVWPILQTINFSLVPEHNRLIFLSICSVMWTTFLAYMKTREISDEDILAVEGNTRKAQIVTTRPCILQHSN